MPTHTLLTPTMIAREALRLLKNNLVMGQNVYRAYESEFPGAPKKGGTVQIRKPVKFVATKSRVRTSSSITEQYITLTVATQAHVSWEFNAVELTLSIEQYAERYIRPAAATLANLVDSDLCSLYKNIWNHVYESTGFVTPHTFMVLGKAMQKLDEEACPQGDRTVVFDPAAHWAMANALQALYIPSVAEKALRKGFLGSIAGADVFMDQNIKTHLTGRWGDSMTATASISLQCATASGVPSGIVPGASGNQHIHIHGFHPSSVDQSDQFSEGDHFEIAGVYAVNPMSGESTGALRSFVVTASVTGRATDTASGSANSVVVPIQPDCINTGPYKTVNTVPATGADVYVYERGNYQYPQNLCFHKNAFALVMVPLEVPQGASFSSTVSEDGYSIRVIKDYDITNDQEIIRLDILYGVKTIYPELAVRISGAKGAVAG